MDSVITNQQEPQGGWKMRFVGIMSAGVGVLAVLFCVMLLLVVVGDMDDYYYVPHACEALECGHPIEQNPDGRTYCAVFPPKDVKMARVSMDFVITSQVIVVLCGVGGLYCGSFTIIAGLLQAVRAKRWPSGRWGTGLKIAWFAGMLLLPFLAILFSFPYGIVPM